MLTWMLSIRFASALAMLAWLHLRPATLMLAELAQSDGDGPGTLRIVLIGLLIVAPIYLFLAFFVRIVRETYGFIEPALDDGPPLRVCYSCDNTILDSEYVHCPYCGKDLPPVPIEEEGAEGILAGEDTAESIETD